MKIFILLILASLVYGNISTKITKTNKQIKNAHSKYKTTYLEVKKTKNKLRKAKRELTKIKKEIRKLTKNKHTSSARLKLQAKTLKNKKKQKSILEENINIKEKAIVSNLVKDMSFVMIFDDEHSNDVDDFIKKDLFKRYVNILQKESKDKSLKLNLLLDELKYKRKSIKNTENKISSIKQEINKKKNLESSKKRIVQKISNNRVYLDRNMKKIKKKEQELRKTLSSLNILKRKKSRKKSQTKTRTRNDTKKIRQVHSSYSSVPIYKYRGKKTISPLKKYKLLKKFGSSYDDFYNMKTFNEFIVLQSPNKRQKVRNVLAGKVVFAKETPTLDKTVIIKHKNGIHTIYSNLSKITPNLRAGKYVKKGSAIGKIDNELTFMVTKNNNKYINPNRFIKLKR